jgi:all-trans-8'-apo-beta-carotenal 15,15'-oxygenase
VARVDVESGAATTHDFGPDGYAGEPLFVPTGAAEDDGVVLTLVYDAGQQRSAMVGLDARNLAAKPIFTARLKHHVPYPLHGFFAHAN